MCCTSDECWIKITAVPAKVNGKSEERLTVPFFTTFLKPLVYFFAAQLAGYLSPSSTVIPGLTRDLLHLLQLFQNPLFLIQLRSHIQPACHSSPSSTCHAELVSASHSSNLKLFRIPLLCYFLLHSSFIPFCFETKRNAKNSRQERWLPLMEGQVPPALPASAQRPVITGKYYAPYSDRLFGESLHNKGFLKSYILLRVVQRTAGAVSANPAL
jgi:hypothetical protein